MKDVMENEKHQCSFTNWFPSLRRYSIKSKIISMPDNVLRWVEHESFVLPIETGNVALRNKEWSDGTPVNTTEEPLDEPTFPEFSEEIQDALDEYGTVFIKCNWSAPSDSAWVTPTKSLKCTTLQEIYLLLKCSEKIAKDLSTIKHWKENGDKDIQPCLVIKKWYDINPCSEFRCFVIDGELIAMSQRDVTVYHNYNESQKFSIKKAIEDLFEERVRCTFPLKTYTMDVVRSNRDAITIADFGILDEASVEGTLFTYEELQNHTKYIDRPECRFIAEDLGIQPKVSPLVVPQEITEFFQACSDTSDNKSALDMIRQEVDNQRLEQEERNINDD